jgi:PKD repeat protein
VSLNVKNGAGSTTVTKKNYITVNSSVTKPVVAFTARLTSGKKPLSVPFKYTETDGAPDSYYLNFGDGANSRHAITVTHTSQKQESTLFH